MIRWLLIFGVAYWCLDQSVTLWAEYGDWSVLATWLIWWWPIPIPMRECTSC